MKQNVKERINIILRIKRRDWIRMAVSVILSLHVLLCLVLSEVVPVRAVNTHTVQSVCVIRVAIDDSWAPIEFYDEQAGTYRGIIASIFEDIEEQGKIRFEYVPAGSYEEALKLVQEGKVDAISGLAEDQEYADSLGMVLTDPYLEIGSSAITRKKITNIFDPGASYRVTLVAGDVENQAVEAQMPNAVFSYYSTTEECIQQVSEGKADIAVAASYVAEYYSRQRRYSELRITPMTELSWDMCVGVGNVDRPAILSRLNDGIAKITESKQNQAIYQGISEAGNEQNWTTVIYKHPVIVFLVAALVIFLLVLIYLKITAGRRRMRKEHAIQEEKLRIALSCMDVCVWELDAVEHRILRYENGENLHGFHGVMEDIPESAIREGNIHKEDQELVRDAFRRSMSGEQDVVACWRVLEQTDAAQEIYVWEEVSMHITQYAHGKVSRILGVSKDVTEEKRRQEAKNKAEHYRELAMKDAVVCYECDLTDNRILEIPELLQRLLELNESSTYEELVAKDARAFVGEAYQSAFLEFLNRERLLDLYERGNLIDTMEYQGRDQDRTLKWLTVSAIFHGTRENHVIFYYMIRNIDEKKRRELELKNSAERDALTQVFNRSTFEELAGQMLQSSLEIGLRGAFFLIDVDDFKSINDNHGHGGGDQALAAIGAELADYMGTADVAGRLGGDEFALFLSQVGSEGTVIAKATELRHRFQELQIRQKLEVTVTCSIGVSISDYEEDTLESLYKKADLALYHVKEHGKNQFSVYDKSMGHGTDRADTPVEQRTDILEQA